jgi:hypothetical protein
VFGAVFFTLFCINGWVSVIAHANRREIARSSRSRSDAFREVQPPRHDETRPTLFVGGSIEMGTAEDWQPVDRRRRQQLRPALQSPPQADWDPTWEQRITNPEFNVQVHWELDMILQADAACFYFDPNTKAPITLMELGLAAGVGKPTFRRLPRRLLAQGQRRHPLREVRHPGLREPGRSDDRAADAFLDGRNDSRCKGTGSGPGTGVSRRLKTFLT